MAKVRNYILDEIDEDDFSLIAINSSCEAYLLAFLLNSKCQCRFIQTKKNKIKEQTYPFESYEWIDPIKGIEIRLFSNRLLIFQNDAQKGADLFNLPGTKELYLVKDLKDVDYVIKLDSGVEEQLMIEKVKCIDQISYQYSIDQSRLDIDLSLNLY